MSSVREKSYLPKDSKDEEKICLQRQSKDEHKSLVLREEKQDSLIDEETPLVKKPATSGFRLGGFFKRLTMVSAAKGVPVPFEIYQLKDLITVINRIKASKSPDGKLKIFDALHFVPHSSNLILQRDLQN